MTVGEFAERCVMYCRVTGASETSGYRTAARNELVGGVEYSAHQVGLGRDVVYDLAPTTAVRGQWATRLGLVIIFEDDHDHLQPLGWRAG